MEHGNLVDKLAQSKVSFKLKLYSERFKGFISPEENYLRSAIETGNRARMTNRSGDIVL